MTIEERMDPHLNTTRIIEETDPTIYLHRVTRAGGEPLDTNN